MCRMSFLQRVRIHSHAWVGKPPPSENRNPPAVQRAPRGQRRTGPARAQPAGLRAGGLPVVDQLVGRCGPGLQRRQRLRRGLVLALGHAPRVADSVLGPADLPRRWRAPRSSRRARISSGVWRGRFRSSAGFTASISTTVSLTMLGGACPYCLTSLALMTVIFALVTFQRPEPHAGLHVVALASRPRRGGRRHHRVPALELHRPGRQAARRRGSRAARARACTSPRAA